MKAFGSSVFAYGGREAEYTYETSATRLSNEEYRIYGNGGEEAAGVAVNGLSGASATLSGAERSYFLTVKEAEDISAMEAAFQRSFQNPLPDNMIVYDMELTDASGIPLKKLGQALSIVMPLPESLQGQKVSIVTLDRNGQLERLAVEQTVVDGAEVLQFEMSNVSAIGIFSK